MGYRYHLRAKCSAIVRSVVSCTLFLHCPIILVNEIQIATHAEAGYWIQDTTVDAISNIEISSDGQVITLYLASNCDITFSRS